MKRLGKGEDFKCRRVHVVGAGVMGGDIAAWCALRGMEVTLQDREMKYIEPETKRAKKLSKKKARSKPFAADKYFRGFKQKDITWKHYYSGLQMRVASCAALYCLIPTVKIMSLRI